jgi:hypothetical protein
MKIFQNNFESENVTLLNSLQRKIMVFITKTTSEITKILSKNFYELRKDKTQSSYYFQIVLRRGPCRN